ncbi:tetratricopeptide repeat protein [Hydrogenophaga sp. NFH-34]|uniref:tetratricopeptide repeat protein n=1 Tax=Hydrogenophaga sp. NFH-34 TaxID=2744446 RepID=UPI001F22EB8D|nr:tetratricopeptide repeat protein [Hydrogenophaga sp. NFH-34]
MVTDTRSPSRFTARRQLLGALLALGAAAPLLGHAASVDEAVQELQRGWETTRYQAPAAEREKRFDALAQRAHALSQEHAGRAEPLVWEGIILSSLAGEKGGLGALPLVKQAKTLYEQAIQIDPKTLDGSAYNSLGVLYYKVPGWPIGFGDKDKARDLLQKALAVNPQGIDANYFYGEFLVETGKSADAVPYLEKALQAPDRPGRPLADKGRRDEARQLLQKAKGS